MTMRNAVTIGQPLHSGELAKLAGVSADSLRHYERVGVLPPPQRTAAGYRVYPRETLDRVLAVRAALVFGFSLAELAGIFGARDRGGVPCRRVRALGEAKLAEIEQQIRELAALRTQLKRTLADWNRRLAKTLPGRRAGLLESLANPPFRMAARPPSKRRGKNFQ